MHYSRENLPNISDKLESLPIPVSLLCVIQITSLVIACMRVFLRMSFDMSKRSYGVQSDCESVVLAGSVLSLGVG
jgi:hypothetical protein